MNPVIRTFGVFAACSLFFLGSRANAQQQNIQGTSLIELRRLQMQFNAERNQAENTIRQTDAQIQALRQQAAFQLDQLERRGGRANSEFRFADSKLRQVENELFRRGIQPSQAFGPDGAPIGAAANASGTRVRLTPPRVKGPGSSPIPSPGARLPAKRPN